MMAFVVWGVQRECQEAWGTVPKLMETCLQFRFRNFRDLWVSGVGWDSGKGRAPGTGRAEARSPFGAAVRLLTQSVLCFALPPGTPRAPCRVLGSRPRPRRPASCATFCRLQRRSCGGSGGKQLSKGRETSSESGSIATALHFLSPLRSCAIAKGPGGSIGVTTQSKWIHVLPGWRTRKSRLKFGLISWGGSQGWREIERVKSGEERSLDGQKELLLARLSFEIGDLPLFAC